MIMATRAAYRDAEHCRANRVRHLRQHFVAAAGNFLISSIFSQGTEPIKSCCNQRFIIVRRDFISRQLFRQKFIVWLVRIERTNHIITKTPRIRAMCVVFKSIGLSIAHDVQPMLPPAFAVMWTCQQFFD